MHTGENEQRIRTKKGERSRPSTLPFSVFLQILFLFFSPASAPMGYVFVFIPSSTSILTPSQFSSAKAGKKKIALLRCRSAARRCLPAPFSLSPPFFQKKIPSPTPSFLIPPGCFGYRISSFFILRIHVLVGCECFFFLSLVFHHRSDGIQFSLDSFFSGVSWWFRQSWPA